MVTKKQVQQTIEKLQDDEREEVFNFINYLLWRKQQKEAESQRYIFSDLASKLSWQGDAVAVQREMRDEW